MENEKAVVVFFDYRPGTERLLVSTNSFEKSLGFALKVFDAMNGMLSGYGIDTISRDDFQISTLLAGKTTFLCSLGKSGLPEKFLTEPIGNIEFGVIA